MASDNHQPIPALLSCMMVKDLGSVLHVRAAVRGRLSAVQEKMLAHAQTGYFSGGSPCKEHVFSEKYCT